jgi:hypothetical protein
MTTEPMTIREAALFLKGYQFGLSELGTQIGWNAPSEISEAMNRIYALAEEVAKSRPHGLTAKQLQGLIQDRLSSEDASRLSPHNKNHVLGTR